MQQHLDPATQHGAAMLDHMINQQAQIIAYVDDYKMMIFTTLPALLLLFLMRRPRLVSAAGGNACGDGLTSKHILPLPLREGGRGRGAAH